MQDSHSYECIQSCRAFARMSLAKGSMTLCGSWRSIGNQQQTLEALAAGSVWVLQLTEQFSGREWSSCRRERHKIKGCEKWVNLATKRKHCCKIYPLESRWWQQFSLDELNHDGGIQFHILTKPVSLILSRFESATGQMWGQWMGSHFVQMFINPRKRLIEP